MSEETVSYCGDYEFRWLGRVGYAEALQLQDSLVEQRRHDAIGDTVLLLEHEPVYTIGRTRDRTSLEKSPQLPHPVVEINRGGKATYHGPGQLVGYPILDLKLHGRDLHAYLRSLEQALIDHAAALGIRAQRREGLTGVWIGPRKLVSLGVGVRHWISMHGFALNVGLDLGGFESIVPCGIADVEMTSLSREVATASDPDQAPATDIDVATTADQLRPHLVRAFEQLRGTASRASA